jgi:hypothetical protein
MLTIKPPRLMGLAAVLLALFLVSVHVSAAPVRPEAKDAKAKAKLEIGDFHANFLLQRSVMRELKCNADQRDAIADALEGLQEKSSKALIKKQQEFFKNNMKPTQEDFKRFSEELQKLTTDMNAEARKVAVKELTYDQLVRLGQVGLRSQGVRALQNPHVVKTLKLTKKQVEAIAKNIADLDKAMRGNIGIDLPGGPGGGPPVIAPDFPFDPAKRQKAEADALKKVVAGLDKDQQAGWKKLTGAPLKYKVMWMGGRGNMMGWNGGTTGIAIDDLPVPAPAPPPGRNK